MVKIIDFKSRNNDSGEEFFALIVQGGVEPVRSSKTGKIYFTARTASVPSTLGEDSCKALIGATFEGSVRKTKCDPYEYTIKETGETIILDYRYEYINEEMELIEEQFIDAESVM